MDERWLEVSPGADEKRAAIFAQWLSGEGVPFVDDAAKAAFQERVTLLIEAIKLEQPPRRVPICPSAGFFPVGYAGISFKEAMYDYPKLAAAWDKYCLDFNPDAYNSPATIVPARPLDSLNYLLYRWPGNGVADSQEYQFVEKEYMAEDEYRELIDDPTGYFLNTYLPRAFEGLQGLAKVPNLVAINEIPCVPPALLPFSFEDVAQALTGLVEAGRETAAWFGALREINLKAMGRGCPSFSGGFTKAPFDVIGDTLRGTRGVLMDLFRRPEELKEACRRLTPFMIKAGVSSCRATGHPMPFIPLHKGADGFMSDQQFSEFYWPSLRKLIIGLIDEGLVPLLFAEGGYNQRLEAICDIPRGKVVWWFDQTDMGRAKETVGKVACICGNVPVSLLCTGSPADVEKYCRELIDTAGDGGGFIFSTGAGMQGSKPENVKAMIDFSVEYSASRV